MSENQMICVHNTLSAKWFWEDYTQQRTVQREYQLDFSLLFRPKLVGNFLFLPYNS